MTCPVCSAEVSVQAGAEVGEIIECNDCSSELEVRGTDPIVLEKAPKEEEDWGE